MELLLHKTGTECVEPGYDHQNQPAGMDILSSISLPPLTHLFHVEVAKAQSIVDLMRRANNQRSVRLNSKVQRVLESGNTQSRLTALSEQGAVASLGSNKAMLIQNWRMTKFYALDLFLDLSHVTQTCIDFN